MWHVQESIITTASPEAIWRTCTDVAHWSPWNPAIDWSRLESAFVD